MMDLMLEEIGQAAAQRQVEMLARLHRVEAVSYTHLRAHETALDLVCRLLLEKKKTIERAKDS